METSIEVNRVNLGDPSAVQKIIDSAPAGLEFLKPETAVFSRFALVPCVEAAFAATHYDEQTGLFRCLGGNDPVCCNKYGAARPSIMALAWHYLNASRADGRMPEGEPILVAPKILRLSSTNLESMRNYAAEKNVTLYDQRFVLRRHEPDLILRTWFLAPSVWDLGEGKILGEAARREALGGARQKRQERSPGWIRTTVTASEVCRNGGATQRSFYQARIVLRCPE